MHFRRNKSARAPAAVEENVNIPQEDQLQTSRDTFMPTQNYQIDQSQYQTPYQYPMYPSDGTFAQTQYSPDTTHHAGVAPSSTPGYTDDRAVAQTQYSLDSNYNTGVVPPSAPVYNDDGSVQTPPDSMYNDDKSQSKSNKKKDKHKGHDRLKNGFAVAGSVAWGLLQGWADA